MAGSTGFPGKAGISVGLIIFADLVTIHTKFTASKVTTGRLLTMAGFAIAIDKRRVANLPDQLIFRGAMGIVAFSTGLWGQFQVSRNKGLFGIIMTLPAKAGLLLPAQANMGIVALGTVILERSMDDLCRRSLLDFIMTGQTELPFRGNQMNAGFLEMGLMAGQAVTVFQNRMSAR